ncbi:MAG: SH3 domain-containing protein [Lachnospiraceae bacterium]|nr:SH3 domain-containing protein [Agathobacter sp.]MDD6446090.1 SH3 domain-containing protein [Lachnospiraceae bacterium]MDY4892554.1 SH3 domain-containing protein [Agathobacter sp.]
MQNEQDNKFMDFFTKYKKYIAAAVVLLFFILILIKCTGTEKKDEKKPDTQQNSEAVTQTTEYEQVGKLAKDADQELVTLMDNYYAAYAAGDIETLEMLAQPLSDNEKDYIETFSAYYEDYQNITCYSAKGATDDSYMVSVCYDLKFKDVDTAAPGMDFFYVERDGKGNLVINNIYSSYNFTFLDQDLDANLYSLILAYEKSDEVVKLQNDVQSRYDEAVKSDEKLANMVGGTLREAMAKWQKNVASAAETQTTETQAGETQPTETQASETQTTEPQTAETGKDDAEKKDTETEDSKKEDTAKDDSSKEDKTKETGTVKTKDICNVRKSPSTDGELLGKVDIDVKLKKLGTKGDWTKVKFQGQTGYIKSDLLKTVK